MAEIRGVCDGRFEAVREALAESLGKDDVGAWGGWGGSLVMVDLDARMTVSYVMNQMLDQGQGDYRGLGIIVAAYEGLA